MDVEKLKQKILDLAIRGKLVPQDPNDEPASVLIEKIKAEKAKLVKEGKIKASRDDSYIFKGSDNSYYENMPKSWVYSRLDYVSFITMGQSPNGDDVFNVEKEDSIEFHQGKLAFSDWLILNSGKYCVNCNKIAEPGSLLFCVRAPVGEINYTNRKIAIGRGLCAIKPAISFIDTKFLYYCLLFLKKFFLSNGSGSTFDAITVDVLKKCMIPIPPLNEQSRIVSILDKTFSTTKSMRDNYNEILNFSEYAKQKILESIFGDNSSYKSYYPSCVLKDVCSLQNGEIINNGTLPYLEAKVIRRSKEPKMVSSGIFINAGTKVILVDGENSGEIMVAPYDGYMGSTFKILSINTKVIDEDYLAYFILYKKQELRDTKTGSAIPHLNKKIFNQFYILLPPKEEQKYFINKINLIFNTLDKIA